VFENRVLRRIFGPKGDEVTGRWRKLHNEELHNLYSSPNTVRAIQSKDGERSRTSSIDGRDCVGKPGKKRSLGYLGVSGGIILKWILGSGLDSSGSG
jgi:hypothetical protein